MVQLVDAEMNNLVEDKIVLLGREHFTFSAVATIDGGFAVAWTQHQSIYLRQYTPVGHAIKDFHVGKATNQIDAIHLIALHSGAIAIECREFLSILENDGLILCDMTPLAWSSTVAIQSNGNIDRFVTEERYPLGYARPPRYSLEGGRFNETGGKIDEFHFDVPSTIVGDTHSRPDHLTSLCLGWDQSVVLWTQAAHHLGNSIQARIFGGNNSDGEHFIIASADPYSSVNRPVAIKHGSDGFLAGWSLNNDPAKLHQIAQFQESIEISRIENIAGNEPDKGFLALENYSEYEVAAIWAEKKELQVRIIQFTAPYLEHGHD